MQEEKLHDEEVDHLHLAANVAAQVDDRQWVVVVVGSVADIHNADRPVMEDRLVDLTDLVDLQVDRVKAAVAVDAAAAR